MSGYIQDQGAPPDQGAALAALLGQQQGAPGPSALMQQPPDQPDQAPDPLSALQDAIHALTSAMVALPDPQDTQDAAKALTQLAAIQTRLMRGAGASPQG